ncbi:peptidoglycan DD-metalloendopeptidase family protein [Psychromonas sp. MME2]|uniref:peptidoglycan DD-metalloendopeptidase family protein n=1 Tax=Psychromonas sp. MME2 TaxID=3231033 RepID=UPI00339D2D59
MPMLFPVLAFLLLISGCSSSGHRAPVSDLSLNKESVATVKQVNKPSDYENATHYKVEAGDTLYSIAWKTGVDVNNIAKYNNLKAPYTIYQGRNLKLRPSLAKKSHSGTVTTVKKTSSTAKKIKSSCVSEICVQNKKEKVVASNAKEYHKHSNKPKASQINVNDKGGGKISNWRWPAAGKLSKTFSSSQAGMKGISISNQRGAPVYVASPGLVVYAGSALRGYGNLIIIKHNNDYLSAYAHNEKLLVNENEQVTAGQVIATMGDSGTETVHLHFEIRYRGKAVDPQRYLPKR